MKNVKLSDVADHAGVSKSTVSQFLNGRFDYMSASTRARIEKAVDELNYVPNNIARSLKTDTTRTVGVVVRDIAGSYSSQAIRGMDDFCRANGYNLFVNNTDFDPATEAKALKSLAQLRVDGVIIASSGQNEALLGEMANQGMPVVQFQLEHDKTPKNVILSDYRQAAFDATEYLIGLGHQRICFVTQEFSRVSSRFDRYRGYAEALEKNGLAVDDRLVLTWQRGSGFQTPPQSILGGAAPPTSFFSQHLAITTDLLDALYGAGVGIPGDVSVLGFDDIPMAQFFRVPITVVGQRPYEIGTEAAKLLIEQIGDRGAPARRVVLPCVLIERESCRDLRAA